MIKILQFSSEMSQKEKFFQKLQETNEKLNKIWDGVHMDEAMRSARFDKFEKLLDDFMEAESKMAIEIRSEIAKKCRSVNEIRRIFSMPPFDRSPYPSNSVALLNALESDEAVLFRRKEAVLGEQRRTYTAYETACRRAGRAFDRIDNVDEEILSDEKMSEIREATHEIETYLTDRVTYLEALRLECKQIRDDLLGNITLTHDENCLLGVDLNDSTTIVSDQLLDRFELLTNKLKDKHEEWLEEMASHYNEIRVKLLQFAKRLEPSILDKYPLTFDPERVDVSDIAAMEADLKMLQERYERGRPIFDKLDELLAVWDEKMATESRSGRVSFYKQRGGQLKASLKRQKELNVLLPKLLAELRALVNEYSDMYDTDDIRVEGMMPDEYAERRMQSRNASRKPVRVDRQRAQIGATSSTASRTASRTPASSTTATASSSTMHCEELSVIGPTRPMPFGPLSSTPTKARQPAKLPTTPIKPMTFSQAPTTPGRAPKNNNNNITRDVPPADSTRLGRTISGKTPLPHARRAITPPSRPWY